MKVAQINANFYFGHILFARPFSLDNLFISSSFFSFMVVEVFWDRGLGFWVECLVERVRDLWCRTFWVFMGLYLNVAK